MIYMHEDREKIVYGKESLKLETELERKLNSKSLQVKGSRSSQTPSTERTWK